MTVDRVLTTEKNQAKNWAIFLVFLGLHCSCLLALWVGVSPIALVACFALYLLRMFAITAGYHRYFSHRSYRTSRIFQFLLAFLGATSAQKGPIWWASHHRHHHRFSDKEEDVHSPHTVGIWWAHVGWVLSSQFVKTRRDLVRDLLQFPELRFLDHFHLLPPLILAALIYSFGMWCQSSHPELSTSGLQMVVWGFSISTVLVYHGTFLVNSVAHLVGSQRFKTDDQSRNSFAISLVTLGEGWHNNHHRYPGSVRQGFYWWEVDLSYYILKALAALGIVWELRSPPERIYREAQQNRETSGTPYSGT